MFLEISDDGRTIAAATFDGSIYLIDESGEVFRNNSAEDRSHEILSLSLSPEGNYLAFSDAGFSPASNPPKRIALMDRNCEELWNHSTRTFVYNSAVSSDGLYSVFGSHENITCVEQDGSILWNYPTAAQVISLDISDDCEYIVAVTDNQEALCLNRSGSELWKNEFRAPSDIKISGDGNYICLTTSLRKVFFMDNKGNIFWNRTLPPGTKYAEWGISHNGDGVVVRSAGSVSAYDRYGEARWNSTISTSGFMLSKDGRYSIIAGGDSLLLLDEKGEETGTFSFNEKLHSVAVSADGARIAAITSGQLYYFDNPDADSKDSDSFPEIWTQAIETGKGASGDASTKQSSLPATIIIAGAGAAILLKRKINGK